MFGAAQLNRFATAVSAARFAVFACALVYRGTRLTGACSGLKTGSKLQEAGFTFSHDAVVRIPLAAASPNGPAVGEVMTLFLPGGPPAGQPVRIAEVLQHPYNPEWRLGVACL